MTMTYDPRFGWSRDNGGYRHRLPGSKRFASLQEAYTNWEQETARKEGLAGRWLLKHELEGGVPRNTPLTEPERRAIQKRHHSELNPPQVDARSEAERRLDELKARREEARLAALSPLDARIEAAERRVAEEQAAATLLAAREAALGTDAGRRLVRELDRCIECAEFDPDVPEADLLELRHQRDMLNQTADVSAAAANVKVIQGRMLGSVEAKAAELRAHADKLAARASRLRAEEPPKPVAITTLLNPQ